MLKRRRTETPSISIQAQFINNHEGTGNSKKVASKNIDNDMVPPTFLKIIEHISQGIFNNFERNRCYHDELEITAYQSLEKPAAKVSQSKDIKTGIIKSTVRIRRIVVDHATVLSIGNFLIVHQF